VLIAFRSDLSPKKIIRSRHSSLRDRLKRSMYAFKSGLRGGNCTGSMSSFFSIALKAGQNLPSRSMSTYRFPVKKPSNVSVKFLPICFIHASSGLGEPVVPVNSVRLVLFALTSPILYLMLHVTSTPTHTILCAEVASCACPGKPRAPAST
jgi:hypothetical protein